MLRFIAQLFRTWNYVVNRLTPEKFRAKVAFHSHDYLRHNCRRLEHLCSLGIPVSGKTVLELGAGLGDHSHYFIDRGCQILITEARENNLRLLKRRYPDQTVTLLDLENPPTFLAQTFDIVHCYGLLYHLGNPTEALEYLSARTAGMLLLETCVSFGDEPEINLVPEQRHNPTQAISGRGCRPTRRWIFQTLKSLFRHVYMPTTQPCHEEFPLDWTRPETHMAPLKRAVFIASREPLSNALLVEAIPARQTRCP